MSAARHSLRWSQGLGVLCLLAALLPAAVRAAPAETAASGVPVDAQGWLARMRAAASERNYQGTMTFTTGRGVLTSSRVAHYCVGEQVFERIEALDGRPRQVLRHNETVHTLWPQDGMAVVEQRNLPTGLPSATQSVDPRALEQYELRLEGSDRVAGREARVLLLQPRDTLRFAQRIWTDRDTGLMLRADVLGADRSVLESAGFSSVDIGVRAQPETVLQPIRQLERLRVLRPVQVATALESEGWMLAQALPGFRLTACVKRPAAVESAPEGQMLRPEGLQAVFSDGLTHVSLFIEPLDVARKRKPLRAQFGATHSLSDRKGEYWVTVVGDAPPVTLQKLFDALQRRP